MLSEVVVLDHVESRLPYLNCLPYLSSLTLCNSNKNKIYQALQNLLYEDIECRCSQVTKSLSQLAVVALSPKKSEVGSAMTMVVGIDSKGGVSTRQWGDRVTTFARTNASMVSMLLVRGKKIMK